ncbi:MAG: YgaP family membrane protein [Thermogutta sp.]
MTIERGLRLMAGVVVTVSAVLAYVHSPLWLILTIFAGLNLFQSAFTNWCPAVWLLKQIGLRPCCESDSPQSASSQPS